MRTFILLLCCVEALRAPANVAARPRSLRRGASAVDAVDSAGAVGRSDDEPQWTGEFREADWVASYKSLPPAAYAAATTVAARGAAPAALRGGALYRCSPANFDRGGRRYAHVLDGDGFVLRVAFDESGATATVSGRYVETGAYAEEAAADEVLYRNTFGTQRAGGWLRNFGDVALKNVANTNCVSWGGRLLALWEAGAPHDLDPETLATSGEASDLCRGPAGASPRGVTIDGGVIDERLGFGAAHTAHPHVDVARGRLCTFTWAQQPAKAEMRLEFREVDGAWEDAAPRVPYAIRDCALAPHDFGVSDEYFALVENRASISLPEFVLGRRGPAQVLDIATKRGARLHLVPRGDSSRRAARVVELPPFFCIHVGAAWSDGDRVRVLSSGWDLRDPDHFPPEADSVPFLGAWSGPAPDFAKIPPTFLFETVVDATTGALLSHAVLPGAEGLCVEHPHVDARQKRPRAVYVSVSNDVARASPPNGYAAIDVETGAVERWFAGSRCFCEELVVVPKDGAGCWLLGLVYDAADDATSLRVFDGERLADGPVSVVPLPHPVPHGLHGCFQPGGGGLMSA